MEKENNRCHVKAVVLSAGKGSRMGQDVPKQYLEVNGKPVIVYSLEAFQAFEPVEEVILVTGAGEEAWCRENIVLRYGIPKVTQIVAGGKERYDSVFAGLLSSGCRDTDYVMIHDGARPMIDGPLLERCLAAARVNGAAVSAMPVKDTIRVCDSSRHSVSVPDRRQLWLMQTPQTFLFGPLMAAYREMYRRGETDGITDDAMVLERFGGVSAVMADGSYRNIKITTPEDLVWMKAML